MNFACIGGDRRQIETARYLTKNGFFVVTYGLPFVQDLKSVDNINDAVSENTIVILPVPLSRDNVTVNCDDQFKPIFISDIISRKPKMVLGGIISESLEQELKNNNILYRDYFKAEPLTVKNAVLTAESAVAIAINSTNSAIFGSKSLVIGYGRIGKQLAKYLKVFGSDVTATSRDEGTRAVILSDGLTALDTTNVSKYSGDFDYIFNTVPSPIMDELFFSNCKKTVFVEDLATNSMCDFEAAVKLGIDAKVYSGLPGKNSPVTAAKYIADEILRTIEILKSEDRE